MLKCLILCEKYSKWASQHTFNVAFLSGCFKELAHRRSAVVHMPKPIMVLWSMIHEFQILIKSWHLRLEWCKSSLKITESMTPVLKIL